MASVTVTSTLARLEGPSIQQSEKASEYQSLLTSIVESPSSPQVQKDLAAFVSSVVSETLGIVTTRTLLELYVEALEKLKDVTIRIESGQHALHCLEPRVASFEDQDARIREILADAYQESEDYAGAAKALQGIQLESSQRKVSDEIKVKTWIRICRLYLEEDDTMSAETYLNRAKTLLYRINDQELSLIFRLSQARILDSRRKFLEASQSYHSVSLAVALAEEERLAALSKAIVCAVLAPAGPDRSRALGKLYKDERANSLDEFGILEKMFLDRTISPLEASSFSSKLEPHQLAQTSDGSTVLTKAIIEHNVLAASKLYKNLGITELGKLLDLDGDKAEEYVARMLEQGRLGGNIDQIEGVIVFHGDNVVGGDSSRVKSRKTVADWDRHVMGLVEDVERVASLIQLEISTES